MNAQSQDTVTFLLATLLSLITLAGLITRFVLMPYLRQHLVDPVKATHAQVTENHHASPGEPTLVDRVDDVARDVRALSRVMDAHMEWSDRTTDLVQRELDQLRRERRNGQ